MCLESFFLTSCRAFELIFEKKKKKVLNKPVNFFGLQHDSVLRVKM